MFAQKVSWKSGKQSAQTVHLFLLKIVSKRLLQKVKWTTWSSSGLSIVCCSLAIVRTLEGIYHICKNMINRLTSLDSPIISANDCTQNMRWPYFSFWHRSTYCFHLCLTLPAWCSWKSSDEAPTVFSTVSLKAWGIRPNWIMFSTFPIKDSAREPLPIFLFLT